LSWKVARTDVKLGCWDWGQWGHRATGAVLIVGVESASQISGNVSQSLPRSPLIVCRTSRRLGGAVAAWQLAVWGRTIIVAKVMVGVHGEEVAVG